MNTSIKRRQTLLINWLAKTLNCQPITRAKSGSYYTEFNTQYTGKSVIRISDHLSGDRTYIHIILSPLNTTVIVNYKNFIWSGTFTNAKQIIYTLIMSKAMTELCNPIPNKVVTVNKKYKASFMAEKKTTNKYGLICLSKGDFKRMSCNQVSTAISLINKRYNSSYTGFNHIPESKRYLSIEDLKQVEKA